MSALKVWGFLPLGFCSILPFLLVTLGCGNSGRVPVYPASGTVLVDGKAVSPSKIIFQPFAENKKTASARGEVSDDGSFSLSTYGNADGIAEGKFAVNLMSDPMSMAPIPAVKEFIIEIKRDDSGKISTLDVDLVSIKGAKPTIGAQLPIPGGKAPSAPMMPMSPPPR